jgi:hypothetical protein
MNFLDYKGPPLDIENMVDHINSKVDNLRKLDFEKKWEIEPSNFQIYSINSFDYLIFF